MALSESLLTQLTETVRNGESLTREDAARAAQALASGSIDATLSERFLEALAEKGETAEEVAGFADTFRQLARNPDFGKVTEQAIDIVGTGGDGAGSFNISTTAALLVAAMGLPVIKHGNRSITSQCGSADFLAALNLPIEADDGLLKDCLAEFNFTFLFAPAFHPAFRTIMPIRRALAAKGRRTIFNLLGPLINPARPAYTLMGVFAPQWVRPLAESFQQLGAKAAAVVHGTLPNGQGIDELTTAGRNVLAGAGELRDLHLELTAESLGVDPGIPEDLRGGDSERNLEILADLLRGTASVTLEETVCLNAGVAWWVAGRSPSLDAGFSAAEEALAGGVLTDWLARVRERFH